MSALVVHLNRGELYDVEPVAHSFEADGPFDVELRNHGQPVHAHLRLEDGLSRVASLSGPNHYVEAESLLRVPVGVDGAAPPAEGTLTVVTGYGNGTAEVSVTVTEADDGAETRPVDEDLGSPTGHDGGRDADGPGVAARLRERLPGWDGADLEAPAVVAAVAVSVLALGAVGVAAAVESTLAVVVAIFVGLAAVGATAYAMVR